MSNPTRRRRRRALMDDKIVPSGQRTPRDKVGDKKGHFPSPSKSRGANARPIDTFAQVIRHGKTGMSVTNWQAFGAKGSKGRILRDARPMRIQNSPVPHVAIVDGRFDQRTGRWHYATPKPKSLEDKPLSQLMREAERSGKPVSPYKKRIKTGNV